MKRCSRCRLNLPNRAFFVRRDHPSLSSRCRKCIHATTNIRRQANPALSRAYQKKSSRTIGVLYTRAQRIARDAGWDWGLTQPQYVRLRRQPCRYCGGPLTPTGVGLDRKDNTRGYMPGNVVPCCRECNVAKNKWFTYKETLAHIGPAVRAIREERVRRKPRAFHDSCLDSPVPAVRSIHADRFDRERKVGERPRPAGL